MLHASSAFSPTSARKCWRGVSKRRVPFSLLISFSLSLSVCLCTMAKICRVISFRASPIGAGVLLECQLRIFLLKARAHTEPARNGTFEHAHYVSRVKTSARRNDSTLFLLFLSLSVSLTHTHTHIHILPLSLFSCPLFLPCFSFF